MLSQNSRVHRDSNFQSGNPFESVLVQSLTFPYTLRNIKCDSQLSFFAHTFASLYFGCEPKVKVVTLTKRNIWIGKNLHFIFTLWFIVTNFISNIIKQFSFMKKWLKSGKKCDYWLTKNQCVSYKRKKNNCLQMQNLIAIIKLFKITKLGNIQYHENANIIVFRHLLPM